MFLSLLNTDQKRLFISLAYDLSTSDGNFSENEKIAIKSYFIEMDIEVALEDVDKDIENVISEININCGIREKKIIVFEIIGLAMADLHYDDEEKEIVRKALDTFGLDAEFGEFCEKKLSEYLNLQEELNSIILS